MDRYILHLYKHYCNSIGKECTELYIFVDNGFIDWIKKLYINTSLYKKYLESLDIVIDIYSSIEIGKGKYDSIGKDYTTIVSPFAETMNLVNSRLFVEELVPIIICGSKIYDIKDCDIFLTHNPFIERDITNMCLLHNLGNNICLGVYGEKCDKDVIFKLKKLKEIINELDNLKFYYDTLDNTYFACIKSSNKVKRNILTK